MVDLGTLLSDIVQTTSFLALPALGIAFLFLVAWEDPGVARASGLTRRTFWLLVPAGLLGAIFGTMPFFGWDGSVLGIDIGGGLFPLIVSGLLLVSAFRPSRRAVAALAFFLLALAIETGILFAVVVLVASRTESYLLVLLISAVAPIALYAAESVAPDLSGDRPHLAAPFAILSGVVFVTFLTTAAVPGVGIVSNFPYYLIAPLGAGAIAVPLTFYGYRRDPRVAPGVAYALATFGTLVGADVLRQPPLYGTGAPGFLVIGGAGLLDLLFLSGLLAAASAYLLLAVSGRRGAPTPDPSPAVPSTANPDAFLSRAVDAALAARPAESVAASAEAARISVRATRRMLGAASPAPGRPWEGLGVPPWFEADHRNLEALAEGGASSAPDVQRAWWTARSQVHIGYALRERRLASALRRGAAFWIDAALTLIPAAIIWAGLASYYGSGSGGPLGSLAFTASA
ncbi:MAG: DUF1614 domain-containing protein, partial [Thermoplasmata archaeon]|nr:DUF1614 domain-containing protein [Thermoplasmata archaeon]